jgi:hypothetical protein
MLSCIPCTDNEHIIATTQNQIEIDATEEHNHDNHDNCNDLCSPFCTCACCGMTINTVKGLVLKQHIPIIVVAHIQSFFYLETPFFQHRQSIFQPPQLS